MSLEEANTAILQVYSVSITEITCKICKNPFRTPIGLKRHHVTVHKPKQSGSISGSTSGKSEDASEKSSPEKANVEAHSAENKPEKASIPFICTICNRSFKTQASLRNHLTKSANSHYISGHTALKIEQIVRYDFT